MAKKIISIVDNLIFLLLHLADKISDISKILIPYMSYCLCAMIGKITEHKFLVLPIPIAVEGFVLDSFAALYRGFIYLPEKAQPMLRGVRSWQRDYVSRAAFNH